jgi:hypothetical protein
VGENRSLPRMLRFDHDGYRGMDDDAVGCFHRITFDVL